MALVTGKPISHARSAAILILERREFSAYVERDSDKWNAIAYVMHDLFINASRICKRRLLNQFGQITSPRQRSIFSRGGETSWEILPLCHRASATGTAMR